jgi:hypothetical protein
MIGQSALAVSLAKDLLNRTYETSAEATFASTRLAQATCYTSSEHRTAVHGFVNRSGRPA